MRVTIPGFDGAYEITETGDVYRLAYTVQSPTGNYDKQERLLKARPNRKGEHLIIDLINGIYLVHRLVLISFVGFPPEDKPFGCHRDDNPLNNDVDNLYWGDKSDNERDKVINGRNVLSNKEKCLRGHRLVHPNLTNASVELKNRTCRSCKNGQEKARYHRNYGRVLDVQLLADEYYDRIMNGLL